MVIIDEILKCPISINRDNESPITLFELDAFRNFTFNLLAQLAYLIY